MYSKTTQIFKFIEKQPINSRLGTIALILSLLPGKLQSDVRDKFSLILKSHVPSQHRNHVYDDEGNLSFEQVLYEKIFEDGNSHVTDWRLNKKGRKTPIKNHKTGKYEATFTDGIWSRRVTSDAMMQTWTPFDIEIDDRNFISPENRKKLYKP